MKRIYGNPRGLFAPILVAFTLLTSLPAASKGHYRGFVEGGLGVTTVSGQSGRKDNGGGVKFGYMLATTHGIQWKNNFFGIGAGIIPRYRAVGKYIRVASLGGLTVSNAVDEGCKSRIDLPIYANWRYDFFSKGDLAPYVGIKIGYYILISDFGFRYSNNWISEHYSNTDHEYQYRKYEAQKRWAGLYDHGNMFVSLDFGIRKKISRKTGVSFGLSILNANNVKAEIKDDLDVYYNFGNIDVEMSKKMGISVLAKVAIDF